SVSLSNQHVYSCLICGKYFQGRGKNTHAYTHSVQQGHHVFINLETTRVYCLPDGYEVIDSSLDDIKRALNPQFSGLDLSRLDSNTTLARDQYGVAYLPGFVGLNNLKATDFVNVTLHALAHYPADGLVSDAPDFFLRPSNYASSKDPLVHAFGEVMRRIWSKDNFKSAVSPHEFLQAVSTASKKQFHIGQQAECIDFMSWLLNSLHRGLGGTRKPNSSIIYKTFQGIVHLDTYTKKKAGISDPAEGVEESKGSMEITSDDPLSGFTMISQDIPFLHLQLDIPPTPLFKDSNGGNIIPQIPLFNVLEKFDGSKLSDVVKDGHLTRRRYSPARLPPFLIFHLARFTKNNFYKEKNPTIVTFPVKTLDLKDYFKPGDLGLPSEESLPGMSVKELKHVLKVRGVGSADCVERAHLEKRVKETISGELSTKYDLVANVCHDSPPGQGKEGQMDPLQGGTYRVHVVNKASDQWYELQDLHVQESMPQLIALSESYVLVYEKRREQSNSEA
ncbi:unnamed protein product, partial [Chrysoparadoxa australica]